MTVQPRRPRVIPKPILIPELEERIAHDPLKDMTPEEGVEDLKKKAAATLTPKDVHCASIQEAKKVTEQNFERFEKALSVDVMKETSYDHEKFKNLSIECQHSYAAMNGRCSFCNKEAPTCMGPGVCICEECVKVSVEYFKENW